MNIDRFLKQPSAWAPREPAGDAAISSRIRLARNLKECAFPGWAAEEECVRVWDLLRETLVQCPSLDEAVTESMENLSGLDKQILFERHLISREHADRKNGSGVVIRADEEVAVMVNEEDHLRIQSMRAGLDLENAWNAVTALDDEIEQTVDYAFSPNYGYLTACPTNVGTGMRASVMLHVPGLVLMGEMNAVVKGMSKIGLAVRGLQGEGSEAAGNMFQVSNQMTLGEREEDIIRNLEKIVLEILEHESNARGRLLESNEARVQDHVGRALGILSNAHILSSKEALDLLSDLRLGIDMGIVSLRNNAVVNELLVLMQPGHLQKMQGRRLKAMERDISRARLVRNRMQKELKKTGKKNE